MSQVRVFVIGAFDRDMILFDKVSSFSNRNYAGVVRGRALRMDVGYPSICLEGDEGISGTVLEFDSSPVILNLLDEFFGYSVQNEERSTYHRVLTNCHLESGESVEVSCYVLNPKKMPKKPNWIPMSDWRSDYAANKPIPEVLEETETDYLCRLGKAKGRDIVPIDMPIYRSLMRDGIIVDKGRRVALSKLGKEVYKYLQL